MADVVPRKDRGFKYKKNRQDLKKCSGPELHTADFNEFPLRSKAIAAGAVTKWQT